MVIQLPLDDGHMVMQINLEHQIGKDNLHTQGATADSLNFDAFVQGRFPSSSTIHKNSSTVNRFHLIPKNTSATKSTSTSLHSKHYTSFHR